MAQTSAAHPTAAQRAPAPPPDGPAGATGHRSTVTWSLRGFTGAGYDKGRPLPVQAAWFAALHLLFVKWWFPARWRPALLRAFGARVGQRVLIRRGVRVHWPWKLDVGDDVWIGEDAWILNLEPVTIGSDCCVSQSALLCTGSHRRRSATFEFDNGPIRLEPGSWVAARAVVLRGVTVGRGAVVGAGAVAHRDLAPGEVLTAGGTPGTDPSGSGASGGSAVSTPEAKGATA
ncbi:DapH/DapD/GlmU-related protein [Streptomyces sp. NPDC003247]|uniref:DapH/DapD/GlmU-related protein n=1 Tax=Streptomyces sp. NPDC003247 TaxID=3364677 RepID=UPI0036A3ADFE